ncbi:cell wall hydrolase [uncultured Sphingomonas sp.]|uniref:cell wall hydrolase n=1 Tax=uncultured Sphingomonas sp. TaxID=158754 RepID=UPI0035CAD4F2
MTATTYPRNDLRSSLRRSRDRAEAWAAHAMQALRGPAARPALVAAALLVVALFAAVVFWAAASIGDGQDERRAKTESVPSRLAPPPVEEQRLLEVPPEAARVLNAERPIVAGPLPAAAPFLAAVAPASRERAVDCLAAASWYEIGDDAVGQRAVMQVILNRARHPAFPRTVCAVVFQGSERTTGCQFTFTCDGSLLRRRPSAAAWMRAQALAHVALNGAVDKSVGFATHYHADYVVPYWASSQDKIAQIGPHIFYRWRGYWGTRAAFGRPANGEEPREAGLAVLSPVHLEEGATPPADGFTLSLPTMTEAGAATAPLPAPMAIEGVREKSLRGALVRGAEADANQYFLQLDPDVFPGNYATAAVALCKGKPTCEVLGWGDPSGMGRSLPLSREQRQALSFHFTRRGEGNDRALWNCRQFPRSNKTQCLTDGAAQMAAS